ncbi:MAG: polysaccharide biosynthesis protein [Bacilli bacterium]|nr:polysaccharide biosynthesis protein [Bacilli bacterium]
MSKKKVMFIASTGGHLSELMELESLFKYYDSCLITEKTSSNMALSNKYNHVHYLVYGTKDHMLTYPFKLFVNCFKSVYYFVKYRPRFIVTTGAHTAGPMCYIGKMFGSKIIFIESMANSSTKTITGKLVYPIADLFVVQWKEMLKLYPKAVYWGWIR